MSIDLKLANFVVTGGRGFLGGHVCEALAEAGVSENHVHPTGKSEFDLCDKNQVEALYLKLKPDVVIHLAAVVGGIGANQENPGRYLYENLVMATELIEAGRRYGKLKKFVGIGTICSYPKFTPIPFQEDDLWNGYPEETNAPYGLAKKMMLEQLQAYRRQYGFPGIFLLPVNLYGPGDNFNPHSSHVIPALIRKFDIAIDTRQEEVVLWGDGSPTREFMHVRDAARAVVLATERYGTGEPVNIGVGMEISIAELAAKLAAIMGYDGRVVWDSTKPNGQPRRMLDVTRARREFGFSAEIGFETGLRETVMWWRNNKGRFPVLQGD
ncbi:MAG: GDP-fucose synthetase [Acidobacteria bacterium]|nr:GDP-fucose synthetase [Acidobacteriota bacterium]|tara:strand:- start:1055 stop:2029 length:975 start_codon:yes stop_codon:yes gene_type:complete